MKPAEPNVHRAAGATGDKISFLNMEFCSATLPQAVWRLREAAAKEPSWCYVVTPNAAHLARLGKDGGELWRIYRRARFCFLDSRVLALAARLSGLATPPVVPGADLVRLLFLEVVGPDTPICIVGGDADLVRRLHERFPVGRVSHINPSFGFWRRQREFDDVVNFVVAAQADFTLLCVGSPQQEILAERISCAGGARGVGICAGASLEFLTGVKRRAPVLLQRLSLEWAFRLCMEPRRMFHRYFVESPHGVFLVLREAWRH